MVQLPNVLALAPEQLSNLVGGIYTLSLGQSVMDLSTARGEGSRAQHCPSGPAN